MATNNQDAIGTLSIYERELALDALGAIMPAGRSEQLAKVLTDDDVATLRHVAEKGMGENSLRALTSDLGYIEAWALRATGSPLPWPAPLDLVLKFVAHHLWDPIEREKTPSHGMPELVAERLREEGFLRTMGPHAPSTVRRRLSSWSTLTAWRGLEGSFADKGLKKAIRLAARAQDRTRERKSGLAVTAEMLGRILAKLDLIVAARVAEDDREGQAFRLSALRDRAILSLAFAAGGRRRSEVAGLFHSQISEMPPLLENAVDGPREVPVMRISLGRTKTTDAEGGHSVVIAGRAADDVNEWLSQAAITRGPVFRRVSRWGQIGKEPLTDKSINDILKRRAAAAGIDPVEVSAHGLRAGFMTEAMLKGLSLPEAMRQSGHRSVQQAASYFNEAEGANARASRLLP